MPYPMLQFVDSISSTAALRYDFNQSTAGLRTLPLGGDSLNLGVPSWSGDPGGVGGFYGYRSMSLTQRIIGSKATAMAQMSALARELVRPDNFLRYKHDAGRSPVYFKTYRTDPGELSLELTESSDAWDIQVPLIAEPFAYGELQTLSPITINNDPAAGSNPCRATLPTILGDAPTGLRIRFDPSQAADLTAYRHMFAVHSTNSALAGPILWQIGGADGWTAGTDLSGTEADATFSGGNRRSVTFATTQTMISRLSGIAPATLPPGRYRAFVRNGRSAVTGQFGYILRVNNRDLPRVTWLRGPTTTATLQSWIDLGEFSHPWNNAPKGQEGVTVAPFVELSVEKVTGGGTLRLDAFLIVPVETTDTIQNRMLFSDQNRGGISNGGVGVWDADNEVAYAFNSAGEPESGWFPEMTGQLPMAVPGAVNTLHMLQQVSPKEKAGTDASDLLTASSALTISYYPRYVFVGNGS